MGGYLRSLPGAQRERAVRSFCRCCFPTGLLLLASGAGAAWCCVGWCWIRPGSGRHCWWRGARGRCNPLSRAAPSSAAATTPSTWPEQVCLGACLCTCVCVHSTWRVCATAGSWRRRSEQCLPLLLPSPPAPAQPPPPCCAAPSAPKSAGCAPWGPPPPASSAASWSSAAARGCTPATRRRRTCTGG